MGNAKSKNPNTQGLKVYKDSILNKITDDDADTIFTSTDNSKVKSRIDDVAKDFMIEFKNYAPDAKGNPNFEKFESGKRHSFEIPNCPSSEVVGQESSGLPSVAKLDKPADKNKNIY